MSRPESECLPTDSCRSTLPGSSTRSRAQDADAELLHARVQRGPAQAKEGCGSVGASNLPNCSLESRNDFLPFGFFESHPQIPAAVAADWRRIGTQFEFFRGQHEKLSCRDDDSS